MRKMSFGQFRIIGGKWRGRKIKFLPSPILRPTKDFIRETLFNWLNQIIPGKNCLDLFAGAGSLGLEALSRGAGHLTMIESNPVYLENLKKTSALLKAEKIDFYCLEVPKQLAKLPKKQFEIIFLDPPFEKNLILPSLQKLIELELIAPEAYIYIETEPELKIEEHIPQNWKIFRAKKSGGVRFYLIKLGDEKSP
jgi:16S rRNA (guanine966-N2)-methyltransferase